MHSDAEELLLIKTTETRLAALELRALELHAYAVSELIAVPVTHGTRPTSTGFASNVMAEVRQTGVTRRSGVA